VGPINLLPVEIVDSVPVAVVVEGVVFVAGPRVPVVGDRDHIAMRSGTVQCIKGAVDVLGVVG
jgi:hypothetical protein